MNNADWINKAKENRETLASFIGNWHPRSATQVSVDPDECNITAPVAESVRRASLSQIRRKEQPEPVARFEKALESGNGVEVYKLLSAAWFGVPETTDCWHYTGFREAVDLLDDPADDWPLEDEDD